MLAIAALIHLFWLLCKVLCMSILQFIYSIFSKWAFKLFAIFSLAQKKIAAMIILEHVTCTRKLIRIIHRGLGLLGHGHTVLANDCPIDLQRWSTHQQRVCSSFLFKNCLFIFVWCVGDMDILPACLCATCVQFSQRSEKIIKFPGLGDIHCCEPLCGC